MWNENSPNEAAEPSPDALPEAQAASELEVAEPVQTLVRMHMVKALAVCAGSWLFPGLGHVLLGRWIRGLILAVCVFAMFIMGLAMHGKLFTTTVEQSVLEMFGFFANVGVGLPYWAAERMQFGAGLMSARTYDYGTTYLWVAGLLNYLIILDAFDIARGRKP